MHYLKYFIEIIIFMLPLILFDLGMKNFEWTQGIPFVPICFAVILCFTGIYATVYLYKYYRYLSPDGSYGSLAELKFYDVDTNEIVGKHIASRYSDEQVVEKAFDNDYLSNFETDSVDGNWVGVSLKEPRKVSFVRVIPRSDDNDIRVGDTYELMYYNGKEWVKMGKKVATSNVLHYDSVPSKALYWVNNLYRGWDERPFLLREGNQLEWR